MQSAGERPSPREPLVIIPLLLLLAAEFVWFDVQVSRHHAWIYPRWNDQIQYLTESYTAFEDARLRGAAAATWETLVNPSAQGTLHDLAALLLFQVAGPSRGAALAVNLLACCAWQAALYAAMLRLTRRLPLAWAAAALPLALAWAWSGRPGSTVDFRLDHLAMCAMGVTLTCALVSDGLRSRGGSLLFGLATGITLLTRFLTGTYFVMILIATLAWIAAGQDRARRFGNLGLAVAAAAALAGPIMWLNREWVWNYYLIGHFTGPESAIRNPNLGIGASLAFVSRNLLVSHLGAPWWGLVAGGTLLLLPAAWRKPPAGTATAGPRRDWWFWGATFLLAPALVLTLHQQKSEIVLGIMAPGAALLALCLWDLLLARTRGPGPGRMLAVAALGGGLLLFAGKLTVPAGDTAFRQDARKVNALADYIFRQAGVARLKQPRVAVDRVTDTFDAQILRVVVYERHQVWVPFIMTLPTGIAAPEDAVVMERLAQSDFVFLTEEGDRPTWPYDQRLQALRPQIRAWCEANLRHVETFVHAGVRMSLYQRKEIP